MNQINWQPHDRLKTGDVMRVLGLRSYDATRKILEEKGLNSRPIYGRSFTIKYSELVKAGLVNESNS